MNRACLKIRNDVAAGDFAFGRGGATGASPEWAVTGATTKPKSKRPEAASFLIFRQAHRRKAYENNPKHSSTCSILGSIQASRKMDFLDHNHLRGIGVRGVLVADNRSLKQGMV